MATNSKKSRSRKLSGRKKEQSSSMLWLLLTAIFGSGLGGYFNPDLPILGPLMRSLQSSSQTADSTLENPLNAPIPGAGTIAPNAATVSNDSPPPGVLVSTQRPGDKLLIASFNIQVFGKSKLAKPNAMAVIVQTIRQFDLVAIQEVRAKEDDVLPQLIAALNENGRRYNFLIGPRLGRTVSTEQYAFVYDTNRVEYDPSSVGTVPDPSDLLHREPFVARFRTRTNAPERAFTFWMVNIHTDPDEVATEVSALADVFQMMRAARPEEDDVILLGDLNASESQLGRLGQIPGISWVVRGAMTNTRQSKAYDNILFDGPATREYTGQWGVFNFATQFGLSIEQALEVSDHFPVWAEFGIWEGALQQLTQRAQGVQR